MLKIKLARFGKKGQPHYRVVITEARIKRDGKYVVSIGHYAPTQTPKILQIDLDVYKSWLAKGAQPTETVAGLVKRIESGTPFPEKKARLSRKAQAKLATQKADAQAAAEAADQAKLTEDTAKETPTEVAEETVAEDAPSDESSSEATAA